MSTEHSGIRQKRLQQYLRHDIGLLTIDQFCELYNVKRTKCYELMGSGELIARTVNGSMTRIRPIDAEAWASNLDVWTPKKSGKEPPDK